MRLQTVKSIKCYLIYICISLTGIVGCKKDWLEEKPNKSLTVPSTLSDFQALMDEFYGMNANYPILAEMGADGHYLEDVVFQNASNSYFVYKDAYLWSKTVKSIELQDWNLSYKRVLIDNIVLEGLEKIVPTDNIERQQSNDIKGQALFNRARIFFELAQMFAPAYDNNSADQDLGIVLKLLSDVTIPSNRSTVKQTYDQILKDLNEAKTLLPVRPLYLTRASSSAVNALLARVYLSMGNYDSAFTAADNCLKQYSQLLDYNDIPSTAMFMGRYNREVLSHTNYLPGIGGAANNLIDHTLFNLYANNDLRKTRFYQENVDGSISYKGMYENFPYYYFNGLATDEVYLTRAECSARAGRTNDALKDLNDLIVKRWDKNVPYPIITASTADEALSIILMERRKELVFRGTRWMDLRRLNKDPRYAVTLTRTVAGVEYTLEPNSYKYTFPIPDDIIQQTGMKQNPGWP
ncbi:RagB/SusD family nutrient uptake outer membrane protein [Pedobacter frigoris]|uniref:RagB/SusD family nutrient uptake outer membrane protein n=1 Tax=Pedobacter frigoris TaxID=2571272 RepID=UPI00292F85BA|nr:RagB/SusD family nutrient uptake outer membrane protein [Pedobacter frigoris]